ncbi:hypothetical protein GVN18_37225, partial [Pseudomonas sp. ODNR1LW]|nr:hypothetical protein [Pseudomonas sp. ODNR1LW]
ALRLGPGGRVEPAVFRRAQRRHLPSLALGNAVDPLMNDIADREIRGELQEFLLAAADDEGVTDLDQAAARIRTHSDLIFRMPKSVSWTTEGVRFHAHPEGLSDDRLVRLRRFWLSHNDGALSYHLSFSHYYGGGYVDAAGRKRSGYDPSTYYFLSLLQKLAAPKEYALDPRLLKPSKDDPDPFVDVFSDTPLGIDPLDNIRVSADGEEDRRFWPFVKTLFEGDAIRLFRRLAPEIRQGLTLDPGFETRLLDLTPFMETPGLKVPKSRFMFMLHDERFFDRLMPLDPETGTLAPRKRMVQQGCYEPYQDRIRALMKPVGGRPPRAVHLGAPPAGAEAGENAGFDFWDWVERRSDYEMALDRGVFARRNPKFDAASAETESNRLWLPISEEGSAEDRMAALARAMRAGEAVQIKAFPPADEAETSELDGPVDHHIPAFEPGRADCLDYLFLAGFNQNIIDFMNQDTSEILDSIDPIYPDSSEQSDERFFVRYANHRAMITYVPKSRSLEIGNDYIGACPYAFLIHALALHNEFLARGHEQKTMARIDRIEALVDERAPVDDSRIKALADAEPLDGEDRLSQAEFAINQAKLAEFAQYERFRHANPFRYDTERDVFEKLEELRGVSRKNEALSLAVESLEDHASDLSRRQQRKLDQAQKAADRAQKTAEEAAARAQKKIEEAAARRGQLLNILLGMTGFFGAGQMFYWIGEKTAGKDGPEPELPTALATPIGPFGPDPAIGHFIMAATEVSMILALAVFLALLAKVVVDWSRSRRDQGGPEEG